MHFGTSRNVMRYESGSGKFCKLVILFTHFSRHFAHHPSTNRNKIRKYDLRIYANERRCELRCTNVWL